jgi:ABC-type nitrate/sulfonate/bicarbonate transport system substrate-binding protein
MLVMMARATRAAIGLALVALITLGAGSSNAVAQSKLPTITLIATPDDAITPVLYAKSSGMFERAGLDVEITKGTGGAAVTAAVVGGSYDVGHAGLIALLNAHIRHVPVVIIAPGAYFQPQNPYAGLLVSATGGITTAKDLNGKIVASATLGDLATVAIMSWMEANGGDPKSLKFVEIPMSAAGPAIEQNRVYAASVTEPFLDVALQGGKVKMLGTAYASIGSHYLFSAWFTTNDWAAKNPVLVRKFQDVVQRAAAYTNAHPDATAPIIGQFSGIEPGVYEHMSQRAYAGTRLTAADLQPLIEKSAHFGVIPNSFPGKELLP